MGGVGEGVCGGGGMRRSAAAVDFHINGIYSFFSFPAQVGLLPPPPPPRQLWMTLNFLPPTSTSQVLRLKASVTTPHFGRP